MKKIFYFLMIAFLATSLVSCKDDDDDDDDIEVPASLTVKAVSGSSTDSAGVFRIEEGTDFYIALEAMASADNSLEEMTVFQFGVNALSTLPLSSKGIQLSDNETDLPASYSSLYQDTLSFSGSDFMAEGSTEIQFVLNDDDDGMSASIDVIVIAETPLNNLESGSFYHKNDSTAIGWNFIDDAVVSYNDPDNVKDLVSTDTASFTGSCESKSGSSFSKHNSYDYDNATLESAIEVYQNSFPVSFINNPQVDDIYIANLRNGSEYIVIKIIALDPNFDSQGNNDGIITFNYKKQ